jgi:hypothetical protein
MKNLGFVFLAGALSVAVMGCGGKDMPTAEQKARIQAVDASESRAEKAIPANSTSSNTLALMSASFQASRSGNLNDFVRAIEKNFSNTDLQDDNTSTMTSKLQDAQTRGDCSISKSGLDGVNTGDIGSASNVNGTISVSGDKCPVTFSMNVQTDMSGGTGGSMSFTVSYSVKDDDYRKLNDVDSMNLKVSMSANAGGDSASINVSIDGSVHSQKYGDVKLSGGGSGNFSANRDSDGQAHPSGSLEFKFTEAFSDFSVEFGVKADAGDSGQMQVSYQINGNDVSKDEFASYAGELGGAGGTIEGGGVTH